MKRRKFPWQLFAMLLLIIAAFASAALAMKPLIYNAEKMREIKRENKQFYANAEIVQGMVEEAEAAEEPVPFKQLYDAIQRYNSWLVDIRQGNLTNRAATEVTPFSLVQYGLPDEVFGVIRIPAMDVEMPIYLGASEENMANGAAVLSQTSIPIGGENTNAVIAGHRGWNGYPYFMDIEKLQKGDTVTITNLWCELTYKVTEIRIVYPDDIEAILIQEGKDMITLMTCHPPNSGGKYRYLVFCERTESLGGDASVFIPQESGGESKYVAVGAEGSGCDRRQPANLHTGADAGKADAAAGGLGAVRIPQYALRRHQYSGLHQIRRHILLPQAAILRMETVR